MASNQYDEMSQPRSQPLIDIVPDPQDVASRAAGWIADRISQAPGTFRIALAGGNTPRALYRELASGPFRDRIDWHRIELFWGDERYVPQDDIRSNYRMVRETLLAHVPVPVEHVHPIMPRSDIESAARKYEEALKGIYGAETLSPQRQIFDLVLLGVGNDGHTASLFPGDSALEERTRWVSAVPHETEPRITLTYPAIQSSRAVAFLVTGVEKSEAVRRALEGDLILPAARVQSEGDIIWFLDRAAASRLKGAAGFVSGSECRD
ncbi:MAG TPA: 6-phosphogluconolactonase [Rhizomicrobium sp.]|nr:6-phosphogluconolactonase [Rhizomicrobium sp.]